MGNLLTCGILVAEHTQDKHVQRDDEFYDGDNDNDHDMEDASWSLFHDFQSLLLHIRELMFYISFEFVQTGN